MRLIDLAVGYGFIGLICAIAVSRRRAPAGVKGAPFDYALTLLVWPLYVPVLLAPGSDASRTNASTAASIEREHELLLAALDAVRDPTWSRLLPTRDHLRRLMDHLLALDGKVRELDEVLSRDEFDATRADRSLREIERGNPAGIENARLVLESIKRLQALRARAAGEIHELLALCARLRTQVTVMRFAGAATEDVGELVGEILGRVEGVGAALDPALR